MSERLTWENMVAIEPKLARMEAEIKRVKRVPGKPFCANAVWYGWHGHPGFKARFVALVGWYGPHAELASPGTYSFAYRHLYELLPDCWGCSCIRAEDAIMPRRVS